MARQKKGKARPEEIVIAIILVLAFGGYAVRSYILPVLLVLAVALAVGVGLALMPWALRQMETEAEPEVAETRGAEDQTGTTSAPVDPSSWTEAKIAERMRAIDWYQFEKLNGAILRHEGWTVERKGGAAPDGGVDLIAVKNGSKVLVQCKHWRSWKVQEKVVREMLGSMTHFGVTSGAIHTLQGWTQPAADFAAGHGIALADGHTLARRARAALADEDLARWLLDETHHCPKCEAEMVLRTGNFDPFWGCSRFPKCRGPRIPVVEIISTRY